MYYPPLYALQHISCRDMGGGQITLSEAQEVLATAVADPVRHLAAAQKYCVVLVELQPSTPTLLYYLAQLGRALDTG
jgi:hypothetical protein